MKPDYAQEAREFLKREGWVPEAVGTLAALLKRTATEAVGDVERYRTTLMHHFHEKLSMEDVAECAHDLAGERKPTRFQLGMRIGPGHNRPKDFTLKNLDENYGDYEMWKVEEAHNGQDHLVWAFYPDDLLDRVIPADPKLVRAVDNAAQEQPKVHGADDHTGYSGDDEEPKPTLEGPHWDLVETHAAEGGPHCRAILDLRAATQDHEKRIGDLEESHREHGERRVKNN